MKVLKTTLFAVLSLLICHASKAHLLPLASFTGANGDQPDTALAFGSDGALYGATFKGGGGDYGTIFKLASDGALSSLISFATLNDPQNGAYPQGGLSLGNDGLLYGTTFASGRSGGAGTVFSIRTNGLLSTLVTFGNTNGANPQSSLILGSDGSFYGTTEVGGPGNAGTVFRVTTNGVLTSLFAFDAVANDGTGTYTYTNINGQYPGDLILGAGGDFYGTAGGGGEGGVGAVFRITTNGTLAALASFERAVYDDVSGLYSNATGAYPNRRLTLANDGCLYGTTSDGGTNGSGTIFKVTTNGVLSVVVTFAAGDYDEAGRLTNVDGATPLAGLTLGSDGCLYGSTGQGGNHGNGTLFKLTTAGTFSSLFSFAAGTYTTTGAYTNANGVRPVAPLTLAPDGSLFGTTVSGGTYGRGTIFKYIPGSATLSPLIISAASDHVVLTWTNPAFALQSAPDLGSAFTNVPGALSPYTNPIIGLQQFFRLH